MRKQRQNRKIVSGWHQEFGSTTSRQTIERWCRVHLGNGARNDRLPRFQDNATCTLRVISQTLSWSRIYIHNKLSLAFCAWWWWVRSMAPSPISFIPPSIFLFWEKYFLLLCPSRLVPIFQSFHWNLPVVSHLIDLFSSISFENIFQAVYPSRSTDSTPGLNSILEPPLVLGAFLDNISLSHDGTCTIIRIISKICNKPPPPSQKIVDVKKNKTHLKHARCTSKLIRESRSVSYLTNTCIPTGNFIAFLPKKKKAIKSKMGKQFRNEPSVIWARHRMEHLMIFLFSYFYFFLSWLFSEGDKWTLWIHEGHKCCPHICSSLFKFKNKKEPKIKVGIYRREVSTWLEY